MGKMTQDQYVEKRVAEGFTVEQAKAEYNRTDTPTTAMLKEKLVSDGKAPTKGEALAMMYEAIQNNPNRQAKYAPDFSLSKEYEKLANTYNSRMTNKERENVVAQGLRIKRAGTISEETKQAEIDKTINMSIAEVIRQLKKFEAKVADMESKIDNFDVSAVQAKVDDLTEKYHKKCNANKGNWMLIANLESQYQKDVDKIEFDEIIKPLNDLKIARYEADTYRAIYEARLKFFVKANKDLIAEELTEAKRDEIRGSLLDLAPLVEED